MKSVWARIAVSIAAGATNTYVYGVVNRNAPGPRALMPWTVLDQVVPFVPSAVWVYLSVHALVMFAFFSLDGGERARRFITAYLLALTVGVTVHWFLPTELPRETWPVAGATLSERVLLKLRELDTPTSCLPSMHVAFSWLAALALWKSSKARFGFGAAWALAITASTMLTKQHYLVDVGGGLVLALAVWWVFLALPEASPESPPGIAPVHPEPVEGSVAATLHRVDELARRRPGLLGGGPAAVIDAEPMTPPAEVLV